MGWSWWPSPQPEPWSWGWQAYPAVWLLLIAISAGYVSSLRRLGARHLLGEPPATHEQRLRFGAGVVVLWVALDWPVGALAGHLLLFHAAQFLLVSLVAAPLLLLGLPPWFAAALRPAGATLRARAIRTLAAVAGRPPAGLVLFAAALLVTHLPPVVDSLRPSAFGSLLLVAAWLISGLVLWWPVVGRSAAGGELTYFFGMLYLFVPFLLPKIPGFVYAFRDDTLYAAFAVAPRVWAISPHTDQQYAGLTLWIAGSVMVVGALAVLIFSWYAEDQRIGLPGTLALPADARAVALLFEVPGAWGALLQLHTIIDGALPAHQRGVELTFALREQAGTGRRGPQVVLELLLAGEHGGDGGIATRVDREYAAYIDTIEHGRRSAIVDRLAFRVVTYGSRVT